MWLSSNSGVSTRWTTILLISVIHENESEIVEMASIIITYAARCIKETNLLRKNVLHSFHI